MNLKIMSISRQKNSLKNSQVTKIGKTTKSAKIVVITKFKIQNYIFISSYSRQYVFDRSNDRNHFKRIVYLLVNEFYGVAITFIGDVQKGLSKVKWYMVKRPLVFSMTYLINMT